MFTYEMARRLQPGNAGSSSNITVNALHPGVVRTELSRYLIQDPESFSGKLLTLLATPFTLSPEQVRTDSLFHEIDRSIIRSVVPQQAGYCIADQDGGCSQTVPAPLSFAWLFTASKDHQRVVITVSCRFAVCHSSVSTQCKQQPPPTRAPCCCPALSCHRVR
jgi:hypothetical protein